VFPGSTVVLVAEGRLSVKIWWQVRFWPAKRSLTLQTSRRQSCLRAIGWWLLDNRFWISRLYSPWQRA